LSLESPESSSPLITRAVAAGLPGRPFTGYSLSRWQRQALRLLGRLPQEAARRVVSAFQALSGLDAGQLAGLDAERMAAGRLGDYSALQGRFPVLLTGAGLGGASAYLSLALGGPFLPQSFVFTLKGGSPDGSLPVYLAHSRDLARRLAQENPHLLALQHFDPVHDGWLTRHVNHLRLKLLDLPQSYRQFILERLAPGGTVVYLDCRAGWLRFRLGERHYLQVGGWGDIPAEEFLQGSARLREYCAQAGLAGGGWSLPELPPERGPESEWGTEPALEQAVQAFCQEQGFRFVRLSLPHPHDFSRLAFFAAARLLALQDRQAAGVLVQTFSHFDAGAAYQGGLLPLWLVFNTQDSLRYLERMRDHFPKRLPVYFAALPTFSLTPDMAPWEAWEQVLQDLDWRPVGARRSHYPADAWALAAWPEPLHRLITPLPPAQPAHLPVEELIRLAAQIETNHLFSEEQNL
jgi:hypothetical protein